MLEMVYCRRKRQKAQRAERVRGISELTSSLTTVLYCADLKNPISLHLHLHLRRQFASCLSVCLRVHRLPALRRRRSSHNAFAGNAQYPSIGCSLLHTPVDFSCHAQRSALPDPRSFSSASLSHDVAFRPPRLSVRQGNMDRTTSFHELCALR